MVDTLFAKSRDFFLAQAGLSNGYLNIIRPIRPLRAKVRALDSFFLIRLKSKISADISCVIQYNY